MKFAGLKFKILEILYRGLIKPVLFLFDPEKVHDFISDTGRVLAKIRIFKNITRSFFYYSHPVLRQNISGMEFTNPVGLAAGFDKDALVAGIIPSVGFGFEEIGSITGRACGGNAKPRLWRLKKSKSLCVNYGLKSDGCQKVLSRLREYPQEIPWGISLAKTNDRLTVSKEEGIKDYLDVYECFAGAEVGNYFTINISCPNAFGGEPFTNPLDLNELLSAINNKRAELNNSLPIFIKLPAELPENQLDEIITLAEKYKINGFVCSNLVKSRDLPEIIDLPIPKAGGFSGKPVEEFSNRQIEYIYSRKRGKFILIACGGIFSAADAYKKIRLGANLLQLITGMIFMGPQLIGQINYELSQLLKKDGFTNISQAVGADVV